MNAAGAPQLVFRPLARNDIEAISRVHHRACLIRTGS